MTDHVTVICSDPRNHIWPHLGQWCLERDADLVTSKARAPGGDLLLLISCTEIVGRDIRDKYACTLVIHESALPAGRGWSPFAWQVLEGKREIVISLLEAADNVDSGDLLLQQKVEIEAHELADEFNAKRDRMRMSMVQWAAENFRTAERVAQDGVPTYYPRRFPSDSRIDPARPISDQFDLLRICEPRFPAFFDIRGHRYEMTIRKVAGEGNVR